MSFGSSILREQKNISSYSPIFLVEVFSIRLEPKDRFSADATIQIYIETSSQNDWSEFPQRGKCDELVEGQRLLPEHSLCADTCGQAVRQAAAVTP